MRERNPALLNLLRSKVNMAKKVLTRTVDSAMHEAVAAIASCGVSPVVRVAANEGWMVKRQLILKLA